MSSRIFGSRNSIPPLGNTPSEQGGSHAGSVGGQKLNFGTAAALAARGTGKSTMGKHGMNMEGGCS